MTSKKGKSTEKPLAAAANDAHIALLRGVNVGGKNRLPMADLCAIFDKAGCRDVQTYIQSGNVVFRIGSAGAKRLHPAIARALLAHMGKEIRLVLRTAKELRAIVDANPFLASSADVDRLHVAFLADAPSAAHIAALDAERFKPDVFAVRGREIYLYYPNGLGKSKLTNDYFDRTLKTMSTVRNWRTVLALLERAESRKK